MRRTRERPDKSWPSWRYGPNGESAVFAAESFVPYGWTKKPGEPFIPPPSPIIHDKADLLSQLVAKGIEVNPTWGTAQLKKVLDGDSSTTR